MNRALQYLVLGADLLWIARCISITHILGANVTPQPTAWSNPHTSLAVMLSAIWTALYFGKGLAGSCRGWYLPTVFAQIIVAVIYLLVSFYALALTLHYRPSEQTLLLLAGLLSFGFVVIRYIAHWLIDSQLHTRIKRRVVILGGGPMVRELVMKISRHPELGMEVAGVLFPSDELRTAQELTLGGNESVCLLTLNILDRLRRENIHELILVEPVSLRPEIEQMLCGCREAGLRIHVVPQQYELYLSKARLTEIEDVPLLSLEERTLPALGVQAKRLIDLVGAVCLLMLASPFLVFCFLFLRAHKGRALRRELRCGQDGAPFWMYRLNVNRQENHSEIFERFLVHFSFTELPQLWNVLRGEMSLVGPRPETPECVKHYSMWQRQRLTVKPGLTGLAQVYGFREQHSSEERVHFDLQYIFHWSVFLDLCLIIQTMWTLFLRLVQEHRIAIPSFVGPLSHANFEIGGICNADSTQSGAD